MKKCLIFDGKNLAISLEEKLFTKTIILIDDLINILLIMENNHGCQRHSPYV